MTVSINLHLAEAELQKPQERSREGTGQRLVQEASCQVSRGHGKTKVRDVLEFIVWKRHHSQTSSVCPEMSPIFALVTQRHFHKYVGKAVRWRWGLGGKDAPLHSPHSRGTGHSGNASTEPICPAGPWRGYAPHVQTRKTKLGEKRLAADTPSVRTDGAPP